MSERKLTPNHPLRLTLLGIGLLGLSLLGLALVRLGFVTQDQRRQSTAGRRKVVWRQNKVANCIAVIIVLSQPTRR